MTKNKRKAGNQSQPHDQSERSSSELGRTPVPSLSEGAKSEVIYYKPEEDQGVPKNRFTRWIYYRAQIILGVLTLAVVVFYGVQWWEYRNTRELENRAYVAVRSVTLIPDPNTPGVGNLRVNYINTGRTPGQNGQIVFAVGVRESPIPEDAGFNPADHPPGKVVLAPMIEVENNIGIIPLQPTPEPSPSPTNEIARKQRSSVVVPSSTPSPPPAPPAVSSRRIYAWGIITYQDIFGYSHHTKFCFKNTPGTERWGFCETFNSVN